jgi:hypothetical protein
MVRIFISSPGDVVEERERAKSVVEQLRRRYAGRLELRAVLWEDLPLQADMSFQQGIDVVLSQEQGIDIAIFILWSRLGSPQNSALRRPNGAPYRSGTEREFDLMLQARAQSGGVRPDILVYTREDDTSFFERLRGIRKAEQDDSYEQRKLVESFIREEFHDAETKLNLRAYHRFDRPTDFAERLRRHLEELLDALAGGDLPNPVWDIAEKGPPFLGLDAFEFKHAPVFFGREDEIVAVRQLLREQARRGCAFVLITGASGSGKSSLVRAGVLPAVAAHEIDSDVAGWRTAVFTPAAGGGDLMLTLARALTDESASPALRFEPDGLAKFASDLARDPEMVCRLALRPALESGGRRERLLVFVDQLEELFSDQRITAEARDAFACALEALARSGCAWVLATVRSDFYAQCQSLGALVRMKEGGGQFDLVPPGADALDRLISQPAALAGLHFEKRGDASLADVILRDASTHRELLPLLEYLLHQLCEERTAKGVLTFASYEALNGVEGALACRADGVISELGKADVTLEATLDTLLAALVTISGDEQESFVRRRVLRTELEGDDASRVLVATLIRERLLTSSAQPGGPAIVTVAHEALFRVWSRAVAWLKRNREFLRIRARVDERLNQWRASAPETSGDGAPPEGDPSFLLQPGRELNDARDQLALRRRDFTQEERHFIFKSLEAFEEEAWRDTLAAGDEAQMPVHWHRLQAEYASMRDRVLSDLLANGNARERRHAALLLGMVPPQELTRKLVRLVLADGDDAVRRAAAYSLMQLDEIRFCKKIAARAGKLGGESAALGALARLRVAADMQVHAPRFDAWFRTLPVILRRRARLQSWALRLGMAVPVFLAVVIPATLFAVTASMSFKWFPGIFNYAYGQADPNAFMGLFHAATAAILVGGGSALGLTLYRMVFGREHARCHYFQPVGAIVAGAIFGGIGGLLCDVAIAGVFRLEGLQVMGWIAHGMTEKPSFLGFDDLFLRNYCGWVYVLNGAGVGVGMAMTTNRLRGLTRWEELLHVLSETSLSSFGQIGKALRGLTRLAFSYAWPLPASLLVTSLLGLGALHGAGMRPNVEPWPEVLAGGLVRVKEPTLAEKEAAVAAAIEQAITARKEAASKKAEAERRSLTDQERERPTLTGMEKALIKKAAIEGLSETARKDQADKLRKWKTSRWGRIMGIACDSTTKAIGGFFGVVGMGFGIVILRSGINIERRKKIG